MRGFKRDGVTIVFVSHNLQAVTELCDRTHYIKRKAVALGPTAEVIDRYVRDTFASTSDTRTDGEVIFKSVEVTTADGTAIKGPIAAGEAVRVRVDLDIRTTLRDVVFALRVLRSTDQLLAYDGQFPQEELGLIMEAGTSARLDFTLDANLTRGQYYFDLIVGQPGRYVARLTPAGHLTVTESRTWGGIADLRAEATARLTDLLTHP